MPKCNLFCTAIVPQQTLVEYGILTLMTTLIFCGIVLYILRCFSPLLQSHQHCKAAR